jgi:hypothetical protein
VVSVTDPYGRILGFLDHIYMYIYIKAKLNFMVPRGQRDGYI